MGLNFFSGYGTLDATNNHTIFGRETLFNNPQIAELLPDLNFALLDYAFTIDQQEITAVLILAEGPVRY